MLFNDLSSKLEPEVLRTVTVAELLFLNVLRFQLPTVQLRHPTEDHLPLRYYLIMAEYYTTDPTKAAQIQQLGLLVWNNPHFHLIHSLILYKWVCAPSPLWSEKTR